MWNSPVRVWQYLKYHTQISWLWSLLRWLLHCFPSNRHPVFKSQVKTNYYKLFWIILSHKQRSEWSCIWPNTLTNQTASFGEEEKHQLHFILFLVYSCWQQEQHIRDKLQPKGGSEGNLCYRLSLWLDRNVCVYVGMCVCVYTCVCACVCSRCE